MSISLRELSERINAGIPIGTIVAYYGNTAPSGWLICDGRSCSGTELSRVLGINNVPDLRGRFIRMVGGNAAGMAVAQGDCIRNITGKITTVQFNYNSPPSSSGSLYFTDSYRNGYARGSEYCGSIALDASKQVPTGPENRPVNMAFNYIIRANYSLRIISILYSFLVISLYNVRR